MRSAIGETWSQDQCGGLAVDGGELVAEQEFENSGEGTSATCTDQDSDWMPEQGQTIVSKKDDVYNSDSNDDTDSSECYDLESNQLKQVDYEDEFKDADLEELVNSEGPQEMLRLMLQEQSDEFMA